MNVPQIRNIYRKQGFLSAPGAVKSGFGFIHDGSIDTPLSFVTLPVFNPWPANKKDDLAAFLVEVDTGTAPDGRAPDHRDGCQRQRCGDHHHDRPAREPGGRRQLRPSS